MKKALVIISFGTSYPTGMRAITHIESYIKEHFLEYDCFRAFTSARIVAKLKRQGNEVATPLQLLEYLLQEGYEEVICQPTHMIAGLEFHKMMEQIYEFQTKFSRLEIGKPLLSEERDYEQCVDFYHKQFPKGKEQEAIVLMGHGSSHYANGCYEKMKCQFDQRKRDDIYIGTIQGFFTIEDVIKQLKKREIHTVTIVPLLLVAGGHVTNDMIGKKKSAWKNRLEQEGYQVKTCRKGLGEYDEIAQIYVEHIRKAEEIR